MIYGAVIKSENFIDGMSLDTEGLLTQICLFYAVSVPLSLFLVFRISFYLTSQKNTIRKFEVQSMVMSLIVFFVVIFLVDFFFNYKDIQSRHDEIEDRLAPSALYGSFQDELEELKEETQSRIKYYVSCTYYIKTCLLCRHDSL